MLVTKSFEILAGFRIKIGYWGPSGYQLIYLFMNGHLKNLIKAGGRGFPLLPCRPCELQDKPPGIFLIVRAFG
jgi:hypothetical protein